MFPRLAFNDSRQADSRNLRRPRFWRQHAAKYAEGDIVVFDPDPQRSPTATTALCSFR